MRTSSSRCSILLVATVIALAGACSSDTTTTADTSTTAATSTPSPGSVDADGGGTTTPGDTEPAGGQTTSTTTGGSPDATDATTSTSTAGGGGPDPSVPIVEPASVEAFCALNEQLEELADTQIDVANVSDPEALRTSMAAFLTDNAAVIDQYIAAAPPEIEEEVSSTMAQTRAAVNDPKLFAELMGGAGDTAASERVSDFIDANCPGS